MRFFRRTPVPPEGARLVFADGTVMPLELVYDGKHDGCHAWHATVIWRVGLADSALHVDRLPPRTSISVRVAR